MGSMKEVICNKADDIALEKYGHWFHELPKVQQDEVWKLAEEAGTDYLASQIDAERERRKYGAKG